LILVLSSKIITGIAVLLERCFRGADAPGDVPHRNVTTSIPIRRLGRGKRWIGDLTPRKTGVAPWNIEAGGAGGLSRVFVL
jgi:hypothetical protein